VPDVLVVTKADLGKVATRALSDLRAALRSLDATDTAIVAVSSVSPPAGIGELVDALEAHRDSIDLHGRRVHARRMHALADFVAEHGDRGLRALGGRRVAAKLLAEQDPEADVPSLIAVLEDNARGAR
jgi:LAO/AO transport system kinase